MGVIEVSAPADDVEDLMHSVGESLKAWDAQAGGPQASARGDRPDDDLRRRAALLRHQWRVDGSAIIHSNRPRLGPWLVKMQTFVRRTTWWFVEPVVQQIRQYQRNSGRAIDELAGRQATLLKRMTELEARLALLEERDDERPSREFDEA